MYVLLAVTPLLYFVSSAADEVPARAAGCEHAPQVVRRQDPPHHPGEEPRHAGNPLTPR